MKMINNITEKKRYARVSCCVGFLEIVTSGFLEKIGVWEQLVLRRKRRKVYCRSAVKVSQTKLQKLDHGHTQAVKLDVKCSSTVCRA